MASKNIVWLMDKDDLYYSQNLLAAPTVSKSFRVIFIGIYLLIFFLVYIGSTRIGKITYKKRSKSFLFIGMLVGLAIIIIEDILIYETPALVYNNKTNKIISWTYTSPQLKSGISSNPTGLWIVMEDKVNIFKNKAQKERNMYPIRVKSFEKLVNEKKIKVIPFPEWINKHRWPHVWTETDATTIPDDITGVSTEWDSIKAHSYYLLYHSLTMAYLIGTWDMSIFNLCFAWLVAAVGIEMLVLLHWSIYTTYPERKHSMYIIKKIQLIASGLVIGANFLFIGSAAFRK